MNPTAGSSGGSIAQRRSLVKLGEKTARNLARRHYENFSLAAKFLMPPRLAQDLFNIYAFCRMADDLSDENSHPAQASAAIGGYERLLDQAVAGNCNEPLFCALGDTIQRRNLPLEPFHRLLQAFRQDLSKNRYQTWDELREYTRLSADPVGHIVLSVHNLHDLHLFELSDHICTGLQLANHWQDIAEDFHQRGRIYLPIEDMQKFGVTESDIEDRRFTPNFKALMQFEIDRTRELFGRGRPLLRLVKRPLRIQLALYWEGGMAALRAIERVDYDVLNRNAKLRKWDRARIAGLVLRHLS
ncbi:MAG: squalene synthase HpnC [Calditrichota bacterium]